jgi:predicted transcriptional regulator of viral defense system
MNDTKSPSLSGYLTADQRVLLEAALQEYGWVVTTDQLKSFMPHHTNSHALRIISQLNDAGWLVRIKKGLYQLADLTSLGSITLSRPVVAQLLEPGSYVSFEAALNYHGLHDQLRRGYGSCALVRRPPVDLHGILYYFVTVTKENYFGFEEVTIDRQQARIAHPEKALIDIVRLERNVNSLDHVAEVLATGSSFLNFDRLNEYLLDSPLAVLRIFGLILDALDFPVDERISARSREKKGVSHMLPQSGDFSARWRLYYDADLTARFHNHLET